MVIRPAKQIEVIVRGVLILDRRVLLCRSVRGGYSYLPGGHVEPGEQCATALVREWREELGWRVQTGRLLAVHEHIFSVERKRHHEINIVFCVERGRTSTKPPRSREPEIEFWWCPFDELKTIDLRPAAARQLPEWLASGAPAWIPAKQVRSPKRR